MVPSVEGGHFQGCTEHNVAMLILNNFLKNCQSSSHQSPSSNNYSLRIFAHIHWDVVLLQAPCKGCFALF